MSIVLSLLSPLQILLSAGAPPASLPGPNLASAPASPRQHLEPALEAYRRPEPAGGPGVLERTNEPGPTFLVVAPDRGFLGNEEIRDAFHLFRKAEPRSSLTFVTPDRAVENLREGLEDLGGRMASSAAPADVVVLPLFLSRHEALYRRMSEALGEFEPRPVIAEPFGASYLAEELLFDRVERLLSAARGPATERGRGRGSSGAGGDDGRRALAVVAHGADGPGAAEEIREDLEPLAERAARRFRIERAEVFVDGDGVETSPVEEIAELANRHARTLVIPFNLAFRGSTMVARWSLLERRIGAVEGVVADGRGVVPHDNVHRWLRRTATAHRSLDPGEVGIIFVPHGSDYNWNRRMREALAPMAEAFETVEAFSMVDPHVVERAVRRLEERGVRAAVLLRIFSLEESFRGRAEYILGLRNEPPGGRGRPAPPRISTHLHLATVGGLEDDRLFALGLLDRVRALSTDPARETIFLLGHGAGDVGGNERWLQNLATIADTMRAHGGDAFRAIRYDTWQEDWPERREENVARIRAAVEEASRGAGRVLVVPARTTGRGPAPRYLKGLDFAYGEGFAPHPLFVRWVEKKIEEGIRELNRAARDPRPGPAASFSSFGDQVPDRPNQSPTRKPSIPSATSSGASSWR